MESLLCAPQRLAEIEPPEFADRSSLAAVVVVSESSSSASPLPTPPILRALLRLRRAPGEEGAGFIGASGVMSGALCNLEPVLSPDGSSLALSQSVIECGRPGCIEFRVRWDAFATGIRRFLSPLHVAGAPQVAHRLTNTSTTPRPVDRLRVRGSPLDVASLLPRRLSSPGTALTRWTPSSRYAITVLVGCAPGAAPAWTRSASVFVHDARGNVLLELSTAWAFVSPAASEPGEGSAAATMNARQSYSDVESALALWHCLAPSDGLCDMCVLDSVDELGVAGEPQSRRSAATIAVLGDDGFIRILALSWISDPAGMVPAAICQAVVGDASCNPEMTDRGTAALAAGEPRPLHPVPWCALTVLGVHSLVGTADDCSCMAVQAGLVPAATIEALSLPTSFGLLAVAGRVAPGLLSGSTREQQRESPASRDGGPGIVFIRVEVPALSHALFLDDTEAMVSRLPETDAMVLGWYLLSDAVDGGGLPCPPWPFVADTLPGDLVSAPRHPAVFGTPRAHLLLAALPRLPPFPLGYNAAARCSGEPRPWVSADDARPPGRWREVSSVVSDAFSCCVQRRCMCRGRRYSRSGRRDPDDDSPVLGEQRLAYIAGGAAGATEPAQFRPTNKAVVAAVTAFSPRIALGLSFQPSETEVSLASASLSPQHQGDHAPPNTPLPPLSLAIIDSHRRLTLLQLAFLTQASSETPAPGASLRDSHYEQSDLETASMVVVSRSVLPDALPTQCAQWYAQDCLAAAAADGTVRFFGVATVLQEGVSSPPRWPEQRLVATHITTWQARKRGAMRPLAYLSGANRFLDQNQLALCGIGDGTGIFLLAHALGQAGNAVLTLNRLRLVSMDEAQENDALWQSSSNLAGSASSFPAGLQQGPESDALRTAAFWRFAASGAGFSFAALREFVLSLTPSPRTAAFGLAVSIRDGLLAQVANLASHHGGSGAFGSDLAPFPLAATLEVAAGLLQVGILALERLLPPAQIIVGLEEFSPYRAAVRVDSGSGDAAPETFEALFDDALPLPALVSRATAVQAAVLRAAAAGVVPPIADEHILVLSAGVLVTHARRLTQYRDMCSGCGVEATRHLGIFIESDPAAGEVASRAHVHDAAVGGVAAATHGAVPEAQALELAWFCAASDVEILRACVRPSEVLTWVSRGATSEHARTVSCIASRKQRRASPEALLSLVLRCVPSVRPLFSQLFFGLCELMPPRHGAEMLERLELLRLCVASTVPAALPDAILVRSISDARAASLIAIVPNGDPELTASVMSTYLFLFDELELKAVRRRTSVLSRERSPHGEKGLSHSERERWEHARDAQLDVLALTRADVASLCLRCLRRAVRRRSDAMPLACRGGTLPVSVVLDWAAVLCEQESSPADAIALLGALSALQVLVPKHDLPALLRGACHLAADVQFSIELSAAASCSGISPPFCEAMTLLKRWRTADSRGRAQLVIMCLEPDSAAVVWRDVLQPALLERRDTLLPLAAADFLCDVAAGQVAAGVRHQQRPATYSERSEAALALFACLLSSMATALAGDTAGVRVGGLLVSATLRAVVGCPFVACSTSHCDAAVGLVEALVTTISQQPDMFLHLDPPAAVAVDLLTAVLTACRVVLRYASDVDPNGTGPGSPVLLCWRNASERGARLLQQLILKYGDSCDSEFRASATRGVGVVPVLALVGAVLCEGAPDAEHEAAAEALLFSVLEYGPHWLVHARLQQTGADSSAEAPAICAGDMSSALRDALQLREVLEAASDGAASITPPNKLVAACLREALVPEPPPDLLVKYKGAPGMGSSRTPAVHAARGIVSACFNVGRRLKSSGWSLHQADGDSSPMDVLVDGDNVMARVISPSCVASPDELVAALQDALVVCFSRDENAPPADAESKELVAASIAEVASLLAPFASINALLATQACLQLRHFFAVNPSAGDSAQVFLRASLAETAPADITVASMQSKEYAPLLVDWSGAVSALALPALQSPCQNDGACDTVLPQILSAPHNLHPWWRHSCELQNSPVVPVLRDSRSRRDDEGGDAEEYRALLGASLDVPNFSSVLATPASQGTSAAVSRLLSNVGDFAEAVVSAASLGDDRGVAPAPVAVTRAIAQVGAETLLAASGALRSMLRQVPGAIRSASCAPEAAASVAKTAVLSLLSTTTTSVTFMQNEQLLESDEGGSVVLTAPNVDVRPLTTATAALVSTPQFLSPFLYLRHASAAVAAAVLRLWSAGLLPDASIDFSPGTVSLPLIAAHRCTSRCIAGCLLTRQCSLWFDVATGTSLESLAHVPTWVVGTYSRSGTFNIASLQALSADEQSRDADACVRLASSSDRLALMAACAFSAAPPPQLRRALLQHLAIEAVSDHHLGLACVFFAACSRESVTDIASLLEIGGNTLQRLAIAQVNASGASPDALSAELVVRATLAVAAASADVASIVRLGCCLFAAVAPAARLLYAAQELLEVKGAILSPSGLVQQSIIELQQRVAIARSVDVSSALRSALLHLSYSLSPENADALVDSATPGTSFLAHSEASVEALQAGLLAAFCAGDSFALGGLRVKGELVGDALERQLPSNILRHAIERSGSIISLICAWAATLTSASSLFAALPQRGDVGCTNLEPFLQSLGSAMEGCGDIEWARQNFFCVVSGVFEILSRTSAPPKLVRVAASSASDIASCAGLVNLQSALQATCEAIDAVAPLAQSLLDPVATFGFGGLATMPGEGVIYCCDRMVDVVNRILTGSAAASLRILASSTVPVGVAVAASATVGEDTGLLSSGGQIRLARSLLALCGACSLENVPDLLSAAPVVDSARASIAAVLGLDTADPRQFLHLHPTTLAEAALHFHLSQRLVLTFDDRDCLMLAALIYRLDVHASHRVLRMLSWLWTTCSSAHSPQMTPLPCESHHALLPAAGGLLDFSFATACHSPTGLTWLRAIFHAIGDSARSQLQILQERLVDPGSLVEASHIASVIRSAMLEGALLELANVQGASYVDAIMLQSVDHSGQPTPSPQSVRALGLRSVEVTRCLMKRSMQEIREVVLNCGARKLTQDELLRTVGELDIISSVSRAMLGASDSGPPVNDSTANALQLGASTPQPIQARAVHALKSLFLRLLSESVIALSVRALGTCPRISETDLSISANNVAAVEGVLRCLSIAAYVVSPEAKSLASFLSLLCRDHSRLAESAKRTWRTLPAEAGLAGFAEVLDKAVGVDSRTICAQIISVLVRFGLSCEADGIELERLRIVSRVDVAVRSCEQVHSIGHIAAALAPSTNDLASTESRRAFFGRALRIAWHAENSLFDDGSTQWSASERFVLLRTVLEALSDVLYIWAYGHTPALLEAKDAIAVADSSTDPVQRACESASAMALSALTVFSLSVRSSWDAEAALLVSDRVKAELDVLSPLPCLDSEVHSTIQPTDFVSEMCFELYVSVLGAAAAVHPPDSVGVEHAEETVASLVSTCVLVIAAMRPSSFTPIAMAAGLPAELTWQPAVASGYSRRPRACCSAVQLSEEHELVVFGRLAHIALTIACSSPGIVQARGALLGSILVFGLGSPHPAVIHESISLLLRNSDDVLPQGVTSLVCAKASLALVYRLVCLLQDARQRLHDSILSHALGSEIRAAAPPAVRTRLSAQLASWRSFVALGTFETPFAATLPFSVAAMVLFGAWTEAAACADLDQSWARPTLETSTSQPRSEVATAIGSFVKAYLLYCIRALAAVRTASAHLLRVGTVANGEDSAPGRKTPDGELLPWGWHIAEALFMRAAAAADEVLSAAHKPLDSQPGAGGIGSARGGPGHDGLSDEVGGEEDDGVSLAEAGGRFFSFAFSALHAVSKAVTNVVQVSDSEMKSQSESTSSPLLQPPPSSSSSAFNISSMPAVPHSQLLPSLGSRFSEPVIVSSAPAAGEGMAGDSALLQYGTAASEAPASRAAVQRLPMSGLDRRDVPDEWDAWPEEEAEASEDASSSDAKVPASYGSEAIPGTAPAVAVTGALAHSDYGWDSGWGEGVVEEPDLGDVKAPPAVHRSPAHDVLASTGEGRGNVAVTEQRAAEPTLPATLSLSTEAAAALVLDWDALDAAVPLPTLPRP